MEYERSKNASLKRFPQRLCDTLLLKCHSWCIKLFVYVIMLPCVNNYVEIVVWKFVLAPCKRWSDCLWHEKQDMHYFLLIIKLKTDTDSLLIIIAYILIRNKT